MILQFPPEAQSLELNQFLRAIYLLLGLVPSFQQVRTASDYTAKRNDYYIAVTDTAAPRTITLPPLDSIPPWVEYVVKDESGGAGVNNITIDADGAETIDGALTKVISTNYGVVRLIRSDTAWFTW